MMKMNAKKTTSEVNDQRERSIQSYREWLEKFSWNWMGTLKLTSGIPSKLRAEKLFTNWITNLNREEGGDDFRWFRVLERGAGGNNLHFHVLVGGLRNRRSLWTRKWNDLGGDALITPFDAGKKGVLYLLKSVGNDGDLDSDCNLPYPNAAGSDNEGRLQDRKPTPASILVEGIDGGTSPDELKRLFKAYGTILEIAILKSRIDDDVNLFTATITFKNSYAASMAAEARDGIWLRRRPLRVSLWQSDPASRQIPRS